MTAPRGSAPTDAEIKIPDFLLRTPQGGPDITARRKRLLAAGYAPVPANGKAVHIPGWSSLQPTELDIEAWARDRPGDTNTGILTRTTPAVDIDVQDPDMSIELQRQAQETLAPPLTSHFEFLDSIVGRAVTRLAPELILKVDGP